MKVLFITQVVDKDDDILGVYHRWIEELAKHSEFINVIAMRKGKIDLPKNVNVLSLGKEEGVSKAEMLRRFFLYIWRLRNEYDAVFVHMSVQYVVLGAWLWRILGKRVVLWYAHYYPNPLLRICEFLVDVITTSNSYAYPLKTTKLKILTQGIDVNLFSGLSETNFGRRDLSERKFKILFLGRISPVKDLETLIYAVDSLRKDFTNFHLTVVGQPTQRDESYFRKIKNIVASLKLDGLVTFYGNVPHNKTARIYCENNLFVNLTTTGSFDKSILEAMSCEVPVLVCNKAFKNIFPRELTDILIFEEKNYKELAEKIITLSKMASTEQELIGRKLREIIVKEHNIINLTKNLVMVLGNVQGRK